MIPRIIHFVWIGPEMPEFAKANIQRFRELNPGYEVMIHDESSLTAPFSTHFSSQAVCQKADLIRLAALRKHGGWYFDTDFLPLMPIDGLVAAYGATKDDLFLTQQWHHKNPAAKVANGIIGIHKDHPAWSIIESVVSQKLQNPLDYGPLLTTRLHEDPKIRTILGNWWDFYPLSQQAVFNHIDHIYELINNNMTLYSQNRYPMMVHLWAGGKSDISMNRYRDLRIAVLYRPHPEVKPLNAVFAGLQQLGCRVKYVQSFEKRMSAYFIWNGLKMNNGEVAKAARRNGTPVFIVEHGFFDRYYHSQIDDASILHWSNWAKRLPYHASPEGHQKLRYVWPDEISAARVNEASNRVLVIGQVTGDTQLNDSELKQAKDLVRFVRENCPDGLEVVFRPHPREQPKYTDKIKGQVFFADGELKDEILNSRFCVMINSNTAVECLAHGRLPLCFGPSVYNMAGFIPRTSLSTLKVDMERVSTGAYEFSAEEVTNFLACLAENQYSNDELMQGDCLKPLLNTLVPDNARDAKASN